MEIIDYRSQEAPLKFMESIKKTGFSVIKNHPINNKSLNKFQSNWLQKFFNQEAIKNQFPFNKETQHGFLPTNKAEIAKNFDAPDIKEMYQYYPKYKAHLPPELLTETDFFYQELKKIGLTLLKWIEDNSPKEITAKFSQSLVDMTAKNQRSMMRLIHYPPINNLSSTTSVRAAEHEDICLLTVLPSSSKSGLQIKTKDQKWISIPNDENNLIINTGDMLAEITDNYYPSTTHRVINPQNINENTSRIATPLFIHPDKNIKLSTAHTSCSLLNKRLQELGLIK